MAEDPRAERAETIARLEAQRDQALRQSQDLYELRRPSHDRARRAAKLEGRISGLTTAIEALRGGGDG